MVIRNIYIWSIIPKKITNPREKKKDVSKFIENKNIGLTSLNIFLYFTPRPVAFRFRPIGGSDVPHHHESRGCGDTRSHLPLHHLSSLRRPSGHRRDNHPARDDSLHSTSSDVRHERWRLLRQFRFPVATHLSLVSRTRRLVEEPFRLDPGSAQSWAPRSTKAP